MSNHPLKIGVKTHYKIKYFWKYYEIKTFTEILVRIKKDLKVAEHFIIRGRRIVKFSEGIKKDNAGMSNDK